MINERPVAVVGSRGFDDYRLMCSVLDRLQPTLIVTGGAKGADTLAAQYAHDHHIMLKVHLPDWAEHGKAAGPIRNRLIVEDCTQLVAFWDGKSRGTKNAIDTAKRAGKATLIVGFNTPPE